MRSILLEARNQPERLQSGVRKWLTYIALLLTAGGAIGDLICFLDYFLRGEITARFVLKVLTVLVICAAIFFYYLRSLRWDKETDLGPAIDQSLRIGIATALVVLVTICSGFALAGSPSIQRHIEADQRRASAMKSIEFAVRVFYTRQTAAKQVPVLPQRLDQLLPGGTINRSQITDPESHALYEYRPTGVSQYQVCANYAEPSQDDPQMIVTQFSQHGKGRTCYTLDAAVEVNR
jgi:hypothetical protein